MADLTGTPVADLLFGTVATDLIAGLGGDDLLFDGLGGDDILSGGDGNDSIGIERTLSSFAATSSVSLDGGTGNDQMSVIAAAADRAVTAAIIGGDGDDQITVGGFVTATIDAGIGDDRITLASTRATTITLGAGNDTVHVLVDDGALPTEAWSITDFGAGDVLRLGDWLSTALTGWDQFNPFAGGFLTLAQSGADTLLQLDANGGGDGYVTILTLANIDMADLAAANFDGFGPQGGGSVGVIMNGTAGNDTLSGGFGGDTISGNGGHDNIAAGAGDDVVIVGPGSAFVTGGAQDDWIQGGAGDDNLNGEQGDDLVEGNDGDDLLFDTGGGNDTLDGGAGNDAIVIIRETTDSGTVSAFGGTGNDSLRFTGTSDAIIELDGGDGADLLQFIDARGIFIVTLGAGQDRLLLERNAGTDVAARTIIVTDFATGATGDTFGFTAFIDAALTNWDHTSNPFGTGHMRLVQDGADTLVQVDVDGGDDSYTNLAIFENTLASAPTAFNFEGWASDGGVASGTTLAGTNAAETISGTPGADTITLFGGNDIGLGGSGDDHVEGGDGDDRLSGEGGADTLSGGNGNDMLNGGVGIDSLDGGAGNDTYLVDDQADLIFESPGGGVDTVTATAGYYLWANLENLVLDPAAGDIFGVGNDLDNAINGNDSSNLLIGGGGSDTIDGGDGIDALFGETGNDTLNGGTGIDYLVGGTGDDRLEGGDSADALYGEDGNDTLLGGTSFDTDILVGGTGNDTLDGASGLGDYDLMDGGAGDDLYRVDTPADLTFEAADGGTDTIVAAITGAGYYLYANTENLILEGNTPFGVGNERDNVLTGSAAANYLLGGDGNDTLNGKAGNDVLFGESGIDTFIFERGTGGDVIGDFQTGTDRIELTGLGFTSFAQLAANFVEVAGTTAIDLGQGDLIVLQGVSNAQLAAGDFILG